MNNRIKILIFAILFIGIVFGADRILKLYSSPATLSNGGNTNGESVSGEKVKDERTDEISKVKEMTYESFSGEVLESEKTVLIDFYATWCGPCKMLSPIVEEIANERDDIKVVKIDVDLEPELANMYQIYSLPTLVVIESGEEIERSIGLINKETIEEML